MFHFSYLLADPQLKGSRLGRIRGLVGDWDPILLNRITTIIQ